MTILADVSTSKKEIFSAIFSTFKMGCKKIKKKSKLKEILSLKFKKLKICSK